MMLETTLAPILCTMLLGGVPEVTHPYTVGYDLHRIRIDCETADTVIEVGLDKRSSLDSVQQALFAASLTGKTPVVAMIDTDGRVGPYETRIRAAAAMAGVDYVTYSADFLLRWQMTAWFRERPAPQPLPFGG